GVFQKILELVALCSENFCRQLRSDFYAGNGRIFGNIADFVHLDAGLTCKRSFQLFRKGCRFCISCRKRANESRELGLREIRTEVNAGDSGSGQELSETALCSSGTEWNTVQQNLRTRGTEQKSAIAAFIECRA